MSVENILDDPSVRSLAKEFIEHAVKTVAKREKAQGMQYLRTILSAKDGESDLDAAKRVVRERDELSRTLVSKESWFDSSDENAASKLLKIRRDIGARDGERIEDAFNRLVDDRHSLRVELTNVKATLKARNDEIVASLKRLAGES